MRIPSEKSNVFVIHVDIDEPAQLAILIRHILRKRRKLRVELTQQTLKVLGL